MLLRQELRDEEIFFSLGEAQIQIEAWLPHSNQVPADLFLGYRPPAPDLRLGPAPGQDGSLWPSIAGVALNPLFH